MHVEWCAQSGGCTALARSQPTHIGDPHMKFSSRALLFNEPNGDGTPRAKLATKGPSEGRGR